MVRTYLVEKELTPGNLRCPPFGACPQIYEGTLIERSLQNCGIGACPAIYEFTSGSPKPVAEVPNPERVYLIIGKVVDPKSVGLENKIGEGEVLIEVPSRLIDDMRK